MNERERRFNYFQPWGFGWTRTSLVSRPSTTVSVAAFLFFTKFLLRDKPFLFLSRRNLYIFSCEGSYKWCHLTQMAWKSKKRFRGDRTFPPCLVRLSLRAVTAFKHTWNDRNMFSQAIAFLRFLIRFSSATLFFINCRFHPPKHEHAVDDDERKVSFWLVEERKLFLFFQLLSFFFSVSKSFICFFRERRVLCPFLMIIWFSSFSLRRSNCWVVKCYVA